MLRPALLVLVLAVSLHAASAAAQDDPFAGLSEVEALAALQILDEADAAAGAERWTEALDAYRRFHAIVNVELIRFSEVQCLVNLARYTEAADLLRILGRSDDPELASRADEEARLLIEQHPARFMLSAVPGPVRLSIDGEDVRELDADPVVIEADPGEYHLVFSREGYETSVLTVRAEIGAEVVEHVELVALAPVVQVVAEQVHIADVEVPSSHPSRARTIATLSLLGAAVGAGVGGIVLHGQSTRHVTQHERMLESGEDSASDINDEGQAAIDAARVRNVLLGTSAGLAVGAGVVYAVLLGRRDEQVAGARLYFAGSSAGVSCRW